MNEFNIFTILTTVFTTFKPFWNMFWIVFVFSRIPVFLFNRIRLFQVLVTALPVTRETTFNSSLSLSNFISFIASVASCCFPSNSTSCLMLRSFSRAVSLRFICVTCSSFVRPPAAFLHPLGCVVSVRLFLLVSLVLPYLVLLFISGSVRVFVPSTFVLIQRVSDWRPTSWLVSWKEFLLAGCLVLFRPASAPFVTSD